MLANFRNFFPFSVAKLANFSLFPTFEPFFKIFGKNFFSPEFILTTFLRFLGSIKPSVVFSKSSDLFLIYFGSLVHTLAIDFGRLW